MVRPVQNWDSIYDAMASNRVLLMKNLVFAAAAIVALAAAGSAAATTYMFDFQNADPSDAYGAVEVTGTFTASSALSSVITGATGTVSTGPVPLLPAGSIAGLSPYAGADNTLYAVGVNTNDNVSFGGVSFNVGGDGGENYN